MATAGCFGDAPGQWYADGLDTSIVRHRPKFETPWHEHEGACVHVVLSGAYAESTRSDTLIAGVGSVVYKPAGLEHRNEFGERGSRALRVEIEAGRDESRLIGQLSTLRAPEFLPFALGIERELQHSDDLSPDAVAALTEAIVVGVRCSILRNERSPGNRSPDLIDRCEQLLEERFRDRLGVGDLAEEIGVHRATICRAFRSARGQTVGQWLRSRRVAEAMRLLANTEIPLAAIAIDCGFCDQSHLTRAFVLQTGVTPAVWRRAHVSR